jgi:hypothetical protein
MSFDGYESINKNYSQSGQDIFVLMCLNGKKNGTFLDLGCHHPIDINNTFLLEKEYDWFGVSIDIDSSMTNQYHDRKCRVYNEDCTNLDFNKIKNDFESNHIDYLSLDLEPANTTLECLKKIPFEEIEFSVITFEHDSYRFGDFCKDESRKILKSFGYQIICEDVSNGLHIYEDWYYNPKYVPYEKIKELQSNSLEWTEIIFK